ncbi:MAG TPA: hypothetical protein VNC78_09265 [Actinomycetota bacterium]|nr:hypothetical protein [Actinomycetota bacterium]
MACKHCGSSDCTQVLIHLKQSEVVRYFSCHACMNSWWESKGSVVELDEVLMAVDF